MAAGGFAVRGVLWWSRLELSSLRVPDSPVEVAWCEGCTDGSAHDCQLLDRLHVEAQTLAPSGPGVLVVRPSAVLGKAAVLELTATHLP